MPYSKDKLLTMVNHFITLVEQVYDDVEEQAEQQSITISGKKYVPAATYRLHIRTMRAQVVGMLKKDLRW